jgi:tRNA G18 (ribose-2'-O)-methylase SpoU
MNTKFDPEIVKTGIDNRNVIDKYKFWKMTEIIKDLDKKRNRISIAIENLGHDFNIGSIIRTANAFLVKEINIIGRKRFNMRGAMVTDKYQHINYWTGNNAINDFVNSYKNQPIIAIDNLDGSTPIETEKLSKDAVFVFGTENNGISKQLIDKCEKMLHITQYGSTRSINVGHAAAIVMHQWALNNLK